MSTFGQELRIGWRMMTKQPWMTAVVVVTLALGIGANTAIFSVVHGVLVRPLPYEEPDRLVMVWTGWIDFPMGSLSVPEFQDVVRQERIFETLGLSRRISVNLTAREGDPEHVEGIEATPGALETLGVRPLYGNGFLTGEDQPLSVILGHRIWQRRFGGDPRIVGRSLELQGRRYLVSGIMPPGFEFPNADDAELMTSLRFDPAERFNRGNRRYRIVARLRPDVPLEHAQIELETLANRLRAAHPDSYPEGSGFTLWAMPVDDYIVGSVRPALVALLGAVGLVLLIACANIGNLLLARATTRDREMAVRSAFGAGRWRILRLLLVESVMVGIVGGATALAVAWVCLQALKVLGAGEIPRLDEVGLDATTLTFTAALALACGLLFGVVPALHASRLDLFGALRDREALGLGHQRLRNLLVVSEVALATVLLIGAGLLIRSFFELSRVDPGFEPTEVVTSRISLPEDRYPEPGAQAAFFQRLLEGIRNVSGVVDAGGVSNPPLSGMTNDMSIGVEGYTPPNSVPLFEQVRVVTPGYFRTLGIPLLQGRLFNDQDRRDSPPVVLVSRSMAKKYWAGDAVGKRIKAGGLQSESPWITVAGVVGDVAHNGLDARVVPIYYLPYTQRTRPEMTVVVRTRDPARDRLGVVHDQVLKLDQRQAVYDVRRMTDVISQSTASRRFNLVLLGSFAALAVVLAVVGIYGVVSYTVGRRTREIGIRLAVGARESDVLRHVLGRGMALVITGLGLGLVSAWGLTRVLEQLVFRVSTTDPWTFAFQALILATVATIACLVPARRATRVDPTVALRHE